MYRLALLLLLLSACASKEEQLKKSVDESNRAQLRSTGGAQQSTNTMAAMMAAQAAMMTARQTCAPYESREVPWAEEQLVGASLALPVLKATPLEDTQPALSHRVALVGKVLAQNSSRASIPWTFGVVRGDTPNAVGFPGGTVLITTGLLRRMSNEAELAGVLAHEIAHVTRKDPLQAWRKALAAQCNAAVMARAMAAVSPSPANIELAKFASKFERGELTDGDQAFQRFLLDAVLQLGVAAPPADAELDADRLGAELVAFAGYDASQYESFLAKLDDEPLTTTPDGKQARTGYLAFKPPTAQRVAKLKALREAELAAFAHGVARPDLTPLVAPLKR
jgi:predicted Zn-dependent protease